MVLLGCCSIRGESEPKPNELTLWCETNNVVSFIDDTRKGNRRNQQDYHETRRWWCNYYTFNAHTNQGMNPTDAKPSRNSSRNDDDEEKFCSELRCREEKVFSDLRILWTKVKSHRKIGKFKLIVSLLDGKDLINFPEIISYEEAKEIHFFMSLMEPHKKEKLPERD